MLSALALYIYFDSCSPRVRSTLTVLTLSVALGAGSMVQFDAFLLLEAWACFRCYALAATERSHHKRITKSSQGACFRCCHSHCVAPFSRCLLTAGVALQVVLEALQFNTLAIDFWLSSCVFPQHTKQFPANLKVSAWHLAARDPTSQVPHPNP